jgi:hypothetical protein
MSLTSEAAQGALTSYFENQGKVQKNQIDLDNDQSMLNWNLENSKQKPLDRQSHLLAGLLSIYAAHPETYGNTDWSKFGDLGPAGVTRADMTYAGAPTLKPGGSSGGTSKTNALLGGLLKGAGKALDDRNAAKNDANARAMNQVGNTPAQERRIGEAGDAAAGNLGDNLDTYYGQLEGQESQTAPDLPPGVDVWDPNYNAVEGYQGGPQEQMQQGPQSADNPDYNYDGDYTD